MNIQKVMKRCGTAVLRSAMLLPALLAAGLLLFSNSLAETGWRELPLALLALALLAVVHVCYLCRKKKMLYIAAAGVVFLACCYCIPRREELEGAYAAFTASYLKLLPLLLVIPAYFLPKVLPGRVALAAGSLAALIAAAFSERMLSRAGVILLILYLLCVLSELVCRRTYLGRGFGTERYLQLSGLLVPVLLCLVLALAVLPARQEPLQWKWVRSAWENMMEAGQRLADQVQGIMDREEPGEFEMAFGGYSAETGANGEVRDGRREEMRINSKQRVDRIIYLAGNYRNTYTGEGWTDTSSALPQTGYADAELNAMELLYAIERDGTEFSDLVRTRQLALTYREQRTTSLFHTATMWKLVPGTVQKKEFAYDASHSSLLWGKTPKRNYSYSFRYLDMNLGNEAFREFVRRQEGFSYESRAEGGEEFGRMGRRWRQSILSGDSDVPENLGELLAEREAVIRAEYLALPEELAGRVKDFARQATEGCEGDYDKLLALEAALRVFSYTTAPGSPGGGQDVVEWFLFEGQQGYCTHFASAMAVLGRCIGIPTRYVQGYAVDMRGTKAEVDYPVYGREAHAWAEAYISGVGWIPFEATPPFYSERYRYWRTEADREAELAAGEAAGTEGAWDGALVGAGEQGAVQESGAKKPEIEKVPISAERSRVVYVLIICVAVLLVAAAGVAVFLFSKAFIYWTRYRRSGEEARIRMDLAQILFLLEQEGFRREEGETLKGYLGRVNHSRPDGAAIPEELCDAYGRYRYREERMSLTELEELHGCRNVILGQAKKRVGAAGYLVLYFKAMIK